MFVTGAEFPLRDDGGYDKDLSLSPREGTNRQHTYIDTDRDRYRLNARELKRDWGNQIGHESETSTKWSKFLAIIMEPFLNTHRFLSGREFSG